MSSNYHCCATCIHFSAEKTSSGMKYHCVRLGFQTRPEYQFNCWEPREDIKKKMLQKQHERKKNSGPS
nr:hypothetical protein [Alkalicoccus halolimnae]TXF81318.1 hypothetical protein FTX54_16005 [Alkalicoccus halolimnae]